MEKVAETNTSSDSEFDDQSDTSSNSSESDDQNDRCKYSDLALELTSTSTSNSTPPSKWRPKPFVVGILLFFGYLVNSMVYHVIIIVGVEMALDEGQSQSTGFSSSIAKVNPIFNMYWYGFMFSAIGGHLAQKFGGWVVLGASTLLSGIFTVATPFSMCYEFGYFPACRGFVGLFQGFSWASYSAVFASWAPKKERFSFMLNVMNGICFGDYVAYLFYVCLTRYWGLSMVFHTIGAISIAWAVLWLILVRNMPSYNSDASWIHESEFDDIQERTGNRVPKKSDLSYGKILKSPSFWALSIGQFATGWSSALIQVYFPFISKDLYGTHWSLCILPVFEIVCSPIIAQSLVFLICGVRFRIPLPTATHKDVIGRGFCDSAILLGIIAVIGDFFILISTLGFIQIRVIFLCTKVHLEMITMNMAPNHAALLSGLTSFWQAIGVIMIQTIVGLEAQGVHLFGWFGCFIMTMAVLLLSGTVFILYGSTDRQPWSACPASKKK